MWDRRKACKNLGIPVRLVSIADGVEGASNLQHRYIHIDPEHAEDDRVWIHEIAHTLLHFQRFETAAVIGSTEQNAVAELEADTVAYIAAKVIGKEDRQDYLKYIKMFMSRLPVHKQSGDVLKQRMPELIKMVKLILNAGGI